MDNKPKKVALLVHSCDRYEFLYKGFEHFFTAYWDFNIPCEYYFATEEKSVSVKGFKNIQSGKGEWADRLAFLLREKIKEDYILYFQEDMWLNKPVDAVFFKKLFELATQKQWKQVKLHSAGVYKTAPTEYSINGFAVSKIDNEASGFLMSHQVTLWEKKFLLEQLHKGEHPWRNERKGTKRLKKINPSIFQIDYFAENGHPEINTNNNPIGRSEYQSISVNGILNHNAKPYISELLAAEDISLRNYAAELQHHYENQLTHDGKVKPRKEDLFKKIKKWLRSKA